MDGTTGHENLWPFLTYSLLVIVVLAGALGLGWLLGGRGEKRDATMEPFESGVVSVGQAEDVRFSIEFYMIAMFFVIFDLETIYIFAWAVSFWDLGWRGYVGAGIFITVLFAVLIYELRTGALDWGPRIRPGARRPVYAGGMGDRAGDSAGAAP